MQRSADGAVALNAGCADGREKASDIEKVHARGVNSDERPTMYRTHTVDPWSAYPAKRVLSNVGRLSRCGLPALGATGSSADLTGVHAERRTPAILAIPATPATLATLATPATNVSKGGTPRSPARAKTGGPPVPEQGDSRPQWAPGAMGGAAKRKRAEGGAVKAT